MQTDGQGDASPIRAAPASGATFLQRPTGDPSDVVNGVIHAHMTLGTGDKAIAGHLEPGAEVFTYAIVTVGVMNNTDLNRIDDKSYR